MLEWGGVPLIERSFEEVCAVLERGGDNVELLVEPAPQLEDSPATPAQPSLHHHALYGYFSYLYIILIPFPILVTYYVNIPINFYLRFMNIEKGIIFQ